MRAPNSRSRFYMTRFLSLADFGTYGLLAISVSRDAERRLSSS
jgi:hypothetical protein